MIRLAVFLWMCRHVLSETIEHAYDETIIQDPDDMLNVTIPLNGTQYPPLAGSLMLPCFFEDLTVLEPGAVPISPLAYRIKWTHITIEKTRTILTAMDGKVRVSNHYVDRVQVLHYPKKPKDMSIHISSLRSSDTGVYRCEVQHSIEDNHDDVFVKVEGIVFHYRPFMGRYTLTFEKAKEACIQNSAVIASPKHLSAAYEDGLCQCDAGWLSDQTVRYSIRLPRKDCSGDKKDVPGVRSYGVREVDETFDVYCFIQNMTGEVIYRGSDDKYNFSQAATACSEIGASLATTGHLYLAWQAGMDVCSAGWLGDGSVRYPINIRRPQCGGNLLGVQTINGHGNQTAFPSPESSYDAFCYKGGKQIFSSEEVSESLEEDGPEIISHEVAVGMNATESVVAGEVETWQVNLTNIRQSTNLKYRGDLPHKAAVFHYRSALGRNTLNFTEAQLACSSIGTSIATPEQLQTAYEDGYDHCAAGWIQDQTVRYPIVSPREECLGNLGLLPGVRSHGLRPADERYDVYCFTDGLEEDILLISTKTGLDITEIRAAFQNLTSFPEIFMDLLSSDLHPTTVIYSGSGDFDGFSGVQLLGSGSGLEDMATNADTQQSSEDSSGSRVSEDGPTSQVMFSGSEIILPGLNTGSGVLQEAETGSTDVLSYPFSGELSGSGSESVLSSGSFESGSAYVSSEDNSVPVETGHGQVKKNGDAIRSIFSALCSIFAALSGDKSLQPPYSREGGDNPCEPNPCGTASCIVQQGFAVCRPLEVCHPNPCANGATCVESAESFTCLCLPTYTGKRCEIDQQLCEIGWTKFQGNCYRHISAKKVWVDAEQHCRNLKAHLVSINTPEEQQFLSLNAQVYQWIGLNDKTLQNDFRWTDDSPMQYENWRPVQPDSYSQTGEDCVAMTLHDGQWNDVPCSYHLPFTCKKGPVVCGSPPKVENAYTFGHRKEEYPVNSIIRYQCLPGLRQRYRPVIRCQANGQWELPLVECVNMNVRRRSIS